MLNKNSEDFEYFHRLHDRMRYLTPDLVPAHRELWERAERELDVPADIVAGHPWRDWTRDRALLNAKRDRLAAVIRAIETAVGLAE